MASRVYESTVIPHPIAPVWRLIRELNMQQIQPSIVRSSEMVDGAPCEIGSVRRVTFMDGVVWELKLVELSEYDHKLTYEIISSNPPMDVLSAIHTITLRRITETNQCFMEWVTDYSHDVTPAVLEDSRHKRRDTFAEIKRILH